MYILLLKFNQLLGSRIMFKDIHYLLSCFRIQWMLESKCTQTWKKRLINGKEYEPLSTALSVKVGIDICVCVFVCDKEFPGHNFIHCYWQSIHTVFSKVYFIVKFGTKVQVKEIGNMFLRFTFQFIPFQVTRKNAFSFYKNHWNPTYGICFA